ncbi:hypothetical protein ACFZA4_43565 [Streptomyces antimycoticus]|uniref:hypothetical protein n=1 Tax=Streptomyces antimycoticus TaxID=68175 RepID=UPI0033FEDBE4|nr:hypothetical protein OG546_47210 [Streptomyces antimycoticus]
MNMHDHPRFPGRLGKEREALDELLRRVNCNDRREQDREPDLETEEYTRESHRLAAVTFLSALL